ncbi:ATP-binding protein [uncultured Croceitalea sp.]|uniref:ATP-binding protein n=1 Tax=uncultured Croceitalea sp. TaxID=1798908 RepID=UPI0033057BEE
MDYKLPLLLFLAFHGLFSQRGFEQDSISLAENKTKVIQFINPQPDSALFYIKNNIQLAESISYEVGIADAEYLLAQYYRRIQKIDSAIIYFKQSALRSKNSGYALGSSIANNGLCRVLYLLGRYEEAEEACNNALGSLQNEIIDSELGYMTKADTHTALGTIYLRKNSIEKAQESFLTVDLMHRNRPLRPDVIAAAFQNLGGIHLDLDDLTLAENYFRRANDEFKKLPPKAAEYYLNSNNVELGKLEFKKENFVKADSLLSGCYTFFKKIGDEQTLSELATSLALIKTKRNDFEKANDLLKEAYSLHEKNGFVLEAATDAIELAKTAIVKKDFKSGMTWANKAGKLNVTLNNSIIKKDQALVLADLYSQLRNYEKAYEYQAIGNAISDSLNQVQSAEAIREIDEKYQSEQRNREIKLLKAENEIAEEQTRNQRNLLLTGIGITSLGGIFLFVLYRNRQKTNKKLREIDVLKTNFFTNISHEFRTPLTLISAPIQESLQEKGLSNEKRKHFEIAQKNTARLSSLVDQLLELSKIDSGNRKLILQKNTPTQMVSAWSESFLYLAEQKKIDFKAEILNKEAEAWFDREALENIVVNLLGNAIKYTPNEGKINLQVSIQNECLKIAVKNSGEGLTSTQIKTIFNRFYQTDGQKEGAGVGLSLVKELAELHGGKINVASELNKWTLFEVSLSVDKLKLKNVEIKETADSLPLGPTPNLEINELQDEVIIPGKELPILLIVEDNVDVRTLLKDTFKKEYEVVQAVNGEEGVLKALDVVPDIIISDLMMPIKDGIELTNTLKNDERTSHIPIILLTAKAGDENELVGIETGADDYITKPFNQKILKSKTASLVALRKKLQSRYSQEVVLKPKDIAITSVDEKFLERVQKILDKKLVESTFSVEQFSKAIHMSRMQLHRKLKALTGLSASEFIKSQRLKLAVQILKSADINISEVGYSVGFNDHAYFSKCFREAYNCTPSDFADAKKSI